MGEVSGDTILYKNDGSIIELSGSLHEKRDTPTRGIPPLSQESVAPDLFDAEDLEEAEELEETEDISEDTDSSSSYSSDSDTSSSDSSTSSSDSDTSSSDSSSSDSSEDSSDYSLALRLTENYHNELINDLIPAVEGKYRTYAKNTSSEELCLSRNHRGFSGFSMGSVTTWRTFQYCLDYFYYFMPMSGSLTNDGTFMNQIVEQSGYDSNDFFIYAMSGSDDFAYSSFASQIENMLNHENSYFIDANSENGNLLFQVQHINLKMICAYLHLMDAMLSIQLMQLL